MRHRTFHNGVIGQAPAGAVIAVQSKHRAMVVLARGAVDAVAAGLERFHGRQFTYRKILHTRTERDHLSA